eukprot:513328_1
MGDVNVLQMEKPNDFMLMYPSIMVILLGLGVIYWKRRNSASTKILDADNKQTTKHTRVAVPVYKQFVIEKSIFKEAWIILKMSLNIGLSAVFEVCVGTVSTIFLGHLPNSSVVLSATSLATSFANSTSMCIAYGFSTALWTLIPQCVGSNEIHLIAVYFQRAIVVCFIVELPLSFVLYYGGDILYAIGIEDVSLHQVTQYCHALIPYPYLMVTLAALHRVSQNMGYTFEVFIIQGITFLLSIPIHYLFIFTFNFGYIGCAYTYQVILLLSSTMIVLLLIWKKHSFIFKPLPLQIICDKQGIYQYLKLAYPGVIQKVLIWIIKEGVILLSGFLINPTINVSATIIMVQLNRTRLLQLGVANASGIRIGKYIGASSIYHAKRCIKMQMMYTASLIIIIFVIYMTFKRELPKLFTNDDEVSALVTQLMLTGILYCFADSIFNNISAIYRALGFQRLSAYVGFISQLLIIFPVQLYLLFGSKFHYRDNEEIGIYIVWIGLLGGFIIASLISTLMLLYYVDWNRAVQESQLRIKQSIKSIRK